MKNLSNSTPLVRVFNDMYSFDHEKLKRLVDLITVVPESNSTHLRGHKYVI